MKRIFGSALVALLLVAACNMRAQQTDLQGNPIDGPRAIETLDQDRAALGSAPTPNQSYLVKQQQIVVASCMASMIRELSNTSDWASGIWEHPTTVVSSPVAWRVTDQSIYLFPRDPRAPHPRITFTKARWDPNSSKIVYGEKKIAQDVDVNSTGNTKLIRNDSDTKVHVTYTVAESETNAFSSSITHGLTMNMSVTSETTVSGSYAGVSAEEKVTAEFGVETSSEESQEKSKEGTTEQSVNVEFDAEPGHYYLVTITKEHAVSYQPFTIDGIMDFDVEIQMPGNEGGRLGSHYPGNKVTTTGGIAGFLQFVYGYDTNYPSMAGFYDASYSRTKNGIACVADPNRRRIQVSGVNQASLESNVDYHIEGLGTSIPDHLKHLPVVDAGDLNSGQ